MLSKSSSNRLWRLLSIPTAIIVSGLILLAFSNHARAEVETLKVSIDIEATGTPKPNEEIQYKILVSTSGQGSAKFVTRTTLPPGLSYVEGSIVTTPRLEVTENAGIISSQSYGLNTGGSVEIIFKAKISETAKNGDKFLVVANLDGTEEVDQTPFSSNATEVISIENLGPPTSIPVDLFIEKTVSAAEVNGGEAFQYTIVITSDGPTPRNFVFTDTLPSELSFVSGSIISSQGLNLTENNGQLVSDLFILNNGQTAEATFSVRLNSLAESNTVVENTVYLYDFENNIHIESTASTLISRTGSTLFLPYITIPYQAPTSTAITPPAGVTNTWTVAWNDLHTANTEITGYEVQESTDPNFADSATTTTAVGKVTSLAISKPVDNQDIYYYRVRSVVAGKINGLSEWSATQSVSSIYFYEEDFNDDSNPENWRIVRQDTDDIVNKLGVHDGYLDLRMESRFDYMIASNLTRVPETGNFKITARMRLEDADPRHAGGIILGGDYDGVSACPESVDEDNPENSKYNTCFTEYYRFMFIAGNVSNQFTTQVKRIEEHSDTNNSGGGTDLASKTFISSKGRKNWIDWTVEVFDDGTMKLYLDDDLIHEVNDTTYQDNKYFGFWSSTSDTSFSNTQIDWVNVKTIN